MGLTIKFLKPVICECRCGDMIFHELFTQGEVVPDPSWLSGFIVSESESGDLRITHSSVPEYVIEGVPSEAIKVLSGDGFPALRRARTEGPRGRGAKEGQCSGQLVGTRNSHCSATNGAPAGTV
jgi:hypothetical protein